MIRINLGKEDSQKHSPTAAGLLGKLKIQVSPDSFLGRISADLKTLVVLVVAGLVATMPYIAFSEYKTFLIRKNEATVRELQLDVDGLSGQIEKLTPFQKELESYDQQRRLVNERLSVVKELLAGRSSTVSVLDAVGQSLPVRSWVTGLDYSLKTKPSVVSIAGGAYSNEDISDFVERLSESIYFADVVLETVESHKQDKIDVKTFIIKATARDGGPQGETVPRRDTAGTPPAPAASQAPPQPPAANAADSGSG